jgi:hypothetical protein
MAAATDRELGLFVGREIAEPRAARPINPFGL